jgi:hypothetical protein
LKDAEGRPSEAYLVCGEVIGIHVEDRFVVDGRVDTAAMRLMARLGYRDYAVVDRTMSLDRPGD